MNIARFTAEDTCSGLADSSLMAVSCPDLDLCHPWDLSVEEAIALARRSEAAARAVDERITNSEGATLSRQSSQFVYANSQGFIDGFPSTRYSLSAAVVAEDQGAMQRDYWYSAARHHVTANSYIRNTAYSQGGLSILLSGCLPKKNY